LPGKPAKSFECVTSVAGSVGPLGTRIEPLGKNSIRRSSPRRFREQIEALRREGPVPSILDLMLFEGNFRDTVEELHQASDCWRQGCGSEMPLVVQGHDRRKTATAWMVPIPETFAPRIEEWGADVDRLGNCSVGPVADADAIERVRGAHFPAAGRRSPMPAFRAPAGSRNIYLCSPEYRRV